MGDLGTGKSTIAGLIVETTLQENPRALAFVVPAKQLSLAPGFTVTELVDEISRYFSQQIAPAESPINLKELLNNRMELTVVLDALDEVARARATALLKQFGALVDHWPNVQTIAAGRPVELSGISYEDWQLTSTVSLGRNEKSRFFHAEAIAEGKSEQQAREIVQHLMARLAASPIADSLAASPLTVRLMYSRLSQISPGNEPTLGDLLCEVVKSRLGAWARMDTKVPSAPLFEEAYPEENSRAALLGRLLLGLGNRNAMPLEEGRQRLQELIQTTAIANRSVIAEEALRFFELSGLIKLGDELEVPAQVFFEVLSGYGLVAAWQGPDIGMPLRPEQWRSVSFAAAILRRYAQLERFRANIITFLKDLMSDREGVAAGAYIVSESKDVSCAKAFVHYLKRLGVRPLTFLKEDWPGSSWAIAESLKLGGQEGFDWFFENYLDPRYPFVFAGSKITEDVFSQWAGLSVGQVSEHERGKLRAMVMPHLEARTMLVHSIVPRLALLVPEAFTLDQRLWFDGLLLSDPLFEKQARGGLHAALLSGDAALVEKVLFRLSETGYESTAPAAGMWLGLKDGIPPSVILKLLTKAVASNRENQDLKDQISQCISRIGTESWKAFLRWSLFDADTHLAAGAAIQLYEAGERNLYVLGEALFRGLHDGGYIRRAEEILSELIVRAGTQGTFWLAGQIASMKEDYSGSHSGHWRLLLKQMKQLGGEGPSVLADCVGSIGEFVLPRYPEVRQLFRDLLAGERRSEYRLALKSCLHSAHFKTRRAAAAVLLTCDPTNDGEALEVAIQAAEIATHWHEWVGFLLGLSFDPAVLIYIKSKLPHFTSKAKALALSILRRNSMKIEDSEIEHLLEWLPEIVYGEAAEFREPSSRRILAHLVERKQSVSAAQIMLRYHREGLPVDLLAACVTLVDPWRIWGSIPLEEQIKRMEHDPEFARAVGQSSARIAAQGGRRPFLDLIGQALGDEAGWEAVVWNLLCDDSPLGGSFDLDTRGQWLLDYARFSRAHSNAIGKAAHKLLNDPRVAGSVQAERRNWLAILADEFSDLSPQEMEKAVTLGSPISTYPVCALLARIGHVPTGFRNRPFPGGVPAVPSFTQIPPRPKLPLAEQLHQLKDLARQSGTLHPHVCQALGDIMLEAHVQEKDLAELSGEGDYGVLIASALAFANGEPPRPQHFVPILSMRLGPNQQNDQCLQHLVRVWRGSHYGALNESAAVRESYVRFLDERLSARGGEICAIAAELLALRGSLSATQAPLVLEHNARFPGYYELKLNLELIRWLASELDPELRAVLREALEKGLTLLDQQEWESTHFYSLTYLVYPLGFWIASGKSSEQSTRRFLLGLKYAFLEVGQSPEGLRSKTLAAIHPLLARVPGAILQAVISQGRTYDDDVVRTICHLLTVRNPGG